MPFCDHNGSLQNFWRKFWTRSSPMPYPLNKPAKCVAHKGDGPSLRGMVPKFGQCGCDQPDEVLSQGRDHQVPAYAENATHPWARRLGWRMGISGLYTLIYKQDPVRRFRPG
ncbi:hypothetical protein ABBQ32_006265 [Trebouxia sp. C0010 RCD-2024]